MGAPKGNQFWKQRSTHGRDMIFASPTILWEACCEYFEATDKRKWVRKDWVGKDAFEVERETDAPYTVSGLCVFLDIDKKTWNNYCTDEAHKDFFPITSRVMEIMFTQKFEGAAVGAFNASIIARDLGLIDKKDLTTDGKSLPAPVINMFPDKKGE